MDPFPVSKKATKGAPKKRKESQKKPPKSQTRNEKNQFLYDFFNKKRIGAQFSNNQKLSFCYKKVMTSIERYPLPILTTKQALELDGIGPKMASMIGILIKNQYKDFVLDENTNVQSTTVNSQVQSNRSGINVGSQFSSQSLFDSDNELLDNPNDRSLTMTNRSVTIEKPSELPKKTEKSEENLFQVSSLKRDPSSREDEEFNYKKTLKKYASDGSIGIEKAVNRAPKMRNYKPDKNSSAATILFGLYTHKSQKGTNYATKKEIKQAVGHLSKIFPGIELTGWTSMNTLLKYEYITAFNFNDEEKFALTDWGLKYTETIYEQRLTETKAMQDVPRNDYNEDSNSRTRFMMMMNEDEKSDAMLAFERAKGDYHYEKIKSEYSFSRSMLAKKRLSVIEEEKSAGKVINHMEVENPPATIRKEELSQSRRLSQRETLIEEELDLSLDENSQLSQSQFLSQYSDSRFIRPFDADWDADENTRFTLGENSRTQLAEPEYKHKIMKKDLKSCKVELYVDNREIKNKTDRSCVYEQLNLNGMTVQLKNLPIGDFLWVAIVETAEGSKVYPLEYIIERKTADDLASSIFDGRYNHQKYRLKASQLKHVYYLCEGKASKGSMLSQSVVDTAMMTTRLVDKFRTQHTKDTEDSINWITRLSMVVEKNFIQELESDEKDYIEFRYTYEEFSKKNSKAPSDPKAIFAQMLRKIKGCGREFVSTVTSQYNSAMDLYKALNRLPSDEARRTMLKGLSSKLSKTTIDHLIVLFCKEEYPKIEKENLMLE